MGGGKGIALKINQLHKKGNGKMRIVFFLWEKGHLEHFL